VQEHKRAFEKFYRLKFKDAEDLIEKIGRKKNFLRKGGQVDYDKTSRYILKDWQLGKIRIN